MQPFRKTLSSIFSLQSASLRKIMLICCSEPAPPGHVQMHLLLIDAFPLLGLHYLLSLPSTFGAQRRLICSRPAVIKMSPASRRPVSRQMMPLLTKPAEEHRDHIERIHLQVSKLTSASSGDSTAQGISRIVGDRGILNAGGAWDRPSVTPNLKVSVGRHGVSQAPPVLHLLVISVHLHSIMAKTVKPQTATCNLSNVVTYLCYRESLQKPGFCQSCRHNFWLACTLSPLGYCMAVGMMLILKILRAGKSTPEVTKCTS